MLFRLLKHYLDTLVHVVMTHYTNQPTGGIIHWYLRKRRTALYARYPAVDPQTKVKPRYRGQAAVRRFCRYQWGLYLG
jgi:hypothetical protein